MAIEITKIINKHLAGRPEGTVPLCVSWFLEQTGGPRKPGRPLEGVWCGRGWAIHNHNGRYILDCMETTSEQRFSLIWL
jgi:hypothetical protein